MTSARGPPACRGKKGTNPTRRPPHGSSTLALCFPCQKVSKSQPCGSKFGRALRTSFASLHRHRAFKKTTTESQAHHGNSRLVGTEGKTKRIATTERLAWARDLKTARSWTRSGERRQLSALGSSPRIFTRNPHTRPRRLRDRRILALHFLICDGC